MSQFSAVSSIAPPPPRRYESPGARALLYKADHPRGIDRYINFFGDGTRRQEVALDPCGEGCLESLA